MKTKAYKIHDHYQETEVMSAVPVKLVSILYRAAIEAVGAARQHLRDGDIRGRSRQITKALEVLYELLRSLDRENGGQIARSLAGLYGYMTGQLIEANARQIDAPLAEVEQLLLTLLDAWSFLPAPAPAEAAEYEPVVCSY